MIWKIDNALEIFWGKVLTPICRLTGKSNFFIARVALGVHFVSFVSTASGKGSERITNMAVLSAMWIGLYGLMIPTLTTLEKAGGQTLPSELLFLKMLRVVYTIGGLLGIPIAPRFSLNIELSMIVLYFATNFQGGGRSLVRKVLDRVKQAFQRSPVAAPSPA